MKTTLKATSKELQFAISNEYTTIEVGANQSLEDNEKTFRPMELLLASISSCSAIDILSILKKQRQSFSDFEIITNGKRADATPAIFEKIDLQINIIGDVDPLKLEKAIELTKEKYCSVYHILSKTAEINYTFKITKS